MTATSTQRYWLADLSPSTDQNAALMLAVDRVNTDLSNIEKVRKFIVAPEPFSVENAQMTPTMKVRRHKLKEVYGERLDALYG